MQVAVIGGGVSGLTCVVDAAEDLPFFFDAVADDPAAAMRTRRSQRVNRLLEAIEYMCSALQPHLEAFVVIVPQSSHLAT
ncbi:MAG: hypothetical protein H0W04_00080 [Chthoniobacterales bacterium]|nr:hypothetical protein [Chthoniobacterales bacterium]